MLNDALSSGGERQWMRRGAIASAKPLAALWAAAGVAVVLGAAGQLLLARALGPTGFGIFVSANSVANLLGPFAAYGIGLMLIQKFGEEGWAARRWVRPSLRLSAVFSIGAIAAFLLWSMTAFESAIEREAAILLAPLVALFAGVQLAESRFQLEHRYGRVAAWQLSKHLFIFIIALLTTLLGWTLMQASLGLSIASATIAAAAFWAGSGVGRAGFLLKGHGVGTDTTLNQTPPSSVTILSEAWPFAATSFVFLFFLQTSIAVVQWQDGTAAAGLYGVAVSVITSVYLMPRILYRKFFLAKVSRWHYKDRARVDAFTWRIVPAVAVLALPLPVLIVWLAPVCIELFFGAAFADSVLPLQILALAIPFRFISAGLTVAAVETHHVRQRVVWQFGIGAASVLATIAVLPAFSLAGAAAVMLGAEIGLAIAFWILARSDRGASSLPQAAP